MEVLIKEVSPLVTGFFPPPPPPPFAGSWVVLRSQLLDVPCEQQEGSDADVSHHATTAGDWCEGADDWGR